MNKAEMVFMSASMLSLVACQSMPIEAGRQSLGSLLASYQFEDVSPPSRIPAPGTIVRVTGTHPLNFNVVCSARQAFGPGWESGIITSGTIDSDTKNKLERTFSIGADYKKLAGASAGADYIEDIKMKLSNAKLLIITSASARSGTPDRECLDAATFPQKVASGGMTMITSALQADVEYTVEFKQGASLSLETKVDLLKNIAGKLGGSASDTGGGTVKGVNLFWGVKRDPIVYAQYQDAHK